jgi:peptidoglycan hydrolase-like protein with peptidoglycan-binding domain
VYPNGLITGYFGAMTKVAVIRFQEKYAAEILTPNGLFAGSGIVGPATRNKMNSLLGAGSSAPAPAALPPGQAVKAALLRTLQTGVSGDDVKTLQELLLKENVYPNGLITGYFGAMTKVAVIRFQEKYAAEILTPNGLSAGSGIVGPATRAKLNQLLK